MLPRFKYQDRVQEKLRKRRQRQQAEERSTDEGDAKSAAGMLRVIDQRTSTAGE